MATEHSATAMNSGDDVASWSGWLAALFGLWVLVSPFVLAGSFGTGSAMYSTVISGIVVTVLAAYEATSLQRAGLTGHAWSGWIASLSGLWILFSPFFIGGSIGAGGPLWSNVVVGFIALVLAAYAASA